VPGSWKDRPKNYLGDFLLKANSISFCSGVDGFQKNPLGDSVQSKDNMRIGKILQNIAFIQNPPLNKHKQRQILIESKIDHHIKFLSNHSTPFGSIDN